MKFLQEIVKDAKIEVIDAKMKNVVLANFRYMNHRDEWVTTDSVAQLLNIIYCFSFERRDIQERTQKEDLEFKKYAAQASRQNLDSEHIPTLWIGQKGNNLAWFLHVVWKRYLLVHKHDMSSMSNMVHTIKNNSGPLKSSMKNIKSFIEVMVHVKFSYLNGNAGIKTLFQTNSLAEKSVLYTGACLRNIENFMTTAENMLLSKDLPAWEQFCSDRNPNRIDGNNSLSESVIQMVNELESSMQLQERIPHFMRI